MNISELYPSFLHENEDQQLKSDYLMIYQFQMISQEMIISI